MPLRAMPSLSHTSWSSIRPMVTLVQRALNSLISWTVAVGVWLGVAAVAVVVRGVLAIGDALLLIMRTSSSGRFGVSRRAEALTQR